MTMIACRLCGGTIEPFLDFGPMPIANGFLRPEDIATERRYPLEVGICRRCAMVQLLHVVPEQEMFNAGYAFFSSTSARMAVHFERFAQDVLSTWLPTAPFVVELGCNDGIMLRHYRRPGVRHLGIEPSANVAAAARGQGLNVIERFFDADVAQEIVEAHGPADALVGANVVCHIPYLDSVFEGAGRLLASEGVFIFEDPYIGDIVRQTAYDQIYDEHIYYFSLASIETLARRHDLEVVDVIPQAVHGGQIRFVLARSGRRRVSDRVAQLAATEQTQGLSVPRTFEAFRAAVERSRDALVGQLDALGAAGQRVVGYGATSKSTTVINYCGLHTRHLEYISDVTPTKIGRVSPGAHIPIRDHAEFRASPPDVALLFAWNHAAEILAKEASFRASGGRFLTYVPRVSLG